MAAGVEFALAIFPEAAALFEPGEGAFDNLTLGKNSEFVQLVALGDFNRCVQYLFDAGSKKIAGIAPIGQDVFNVRQIILVAIKSLQRAFGLCCR